MSSPTPPPAEQDILWNIVEEHLDESEFLFEQWQANLGSPSYTAAELNDGPEERLRAHLDGLALAGGAAAERLLWPAMGGDIDEPCRVSVAALAACRLEDPKWADGVIHEVGICEEPERRVALAAGLAAAEQPDLSSRVVRAFEANNDAIGRAEWLEVIAARGALPGAAADRAVMDPDPIVRAAAARVARFTPRATALRSLERLLTDCPTVACAWTSRGAAAWL